MKRSLCLIAFIPGILSAQTETEATEVANKEGEYVNMPSLHVVESTTAIDSPSAGFATPVTSLRFMPSVDVQSRGFAETQSDVVIRGGIFENTGFKIGAINLMDPQTGHYGAELPIDPLMLSTPRVLTGTSNAMSGFNASVGTVSYSWLPITTGGVAETGLGSDSLFFGRFITGYLTDKPVFMGRNMGIQVSSAYSEGNGTIDFTDNQFQRYGVRLQLSDKNSQTDIYAGYQKKEYSWPGMYTSNPTYKEAEEYEVAMLMLNHTQRYGDDSHWSIGAYARKLRDDYELQQSIPGYYRPYQHKTHISGLALEGQHQFGNEIVLDWRAEAYADKIESTELTYAGFMSRSYWKGSALLGKQFAAASGDLLLQAGVNYSDSNRDEDGTGPMARATYNIHAGRGFISTYAEYSRATQLGGYTALGSNPGPGSFAGDSELGREIADNYELGIQWTCCNFTFGGDIFYREHEDLTDWTYDSTQPRKLRQASEMDLEVRGFETFINWSLEKKLSISLAYTYLDEDPTYATDNVDASFYAMNYPTDRFTGSVVWTIIEGLEFRTDADIRHQEKNALRTSGNNAELFSASLAWETPWVKGMTLAVIMDNISDCDFQEFPGVPANGRQAAFRVSYTW